MCIHGCLKRRQSTTLTQSNFWVEDYCADKKNYIEKEFFKYLTHVINKIPYTTKPQQISINSSVMLDNRVTYQLRNVTNTPCKYTSYQCGVRTFSVPHMGQDGKLSRALCHLEPIPRALSWLPETPVQGRALSNIHGFCFPACVISILQHLLQQYQRLAWAYRLKCKFLAENTMAHLASLGSEVS